MDLLASENGKDGSKNEAGSHTHEQMKAQTAMRAELIQTMHDLRAERGRMDSAMKQRQAILDAIEHCEKTRIDVRQQLRKNAHKMAQEMQEESICASAKCLCSSFCPVHGKPNWRRTGKRHAFAELYAQILFAGQQAESVHATNPANAAHDKTQKRRGGVRRGMAAIWSSLAQSWQWGNAAAWKSVSAVVMWCLLRC
ncbi:unnamed protein product [Effrenium voratum]|nr:unnamed protein product [Effrenium voratum]